MLTAIGIDPNDCIYPIAYAVIEGVPGVLEIVS
jgi:hypothetical protein